MLEVDFFSEEYDREPERTDVRFGIIDPNESNQEEEENRKDEKRERAFTTAKDKQNWHASVTNINGKSLVFMPIDHNIVIHPKPDETRSLCDGMLYESTKQQLIFVELKAKNKTWVRETVKQLKSTIELFAAHHDVTQFEKRVAYAANKRLPRFQYSQKNLMQQFKQETYFRLLIQNEIKID